MFIKVKSEINVKTNIMMTVGGCFDRDCPYCIHFIYEVGGKVIVSECFVVLDDA